MSAGEPGGQRKKYQTVSDTSGGKSVSEKSQTTGGLKSERDSNLMIHGLAKKALESSTDQKSQYYVGVVKDKRTGKIGRVPGVIG